MPALQACGHRQAVGRAASEDSRPRKRHERRERITAPNLKPVDKYVQSRIVCSFNSMRGRRNRDIVVIGPGRMGLGITLAFALAGRPVRVLDVKERADGEHERVVERFTKELASTTRLLKRIRYTAARPADVLRSVSFCRGIDRQNLAGGYVLEALPERPELKIKLFRDISPFIDKDAVVASTTSTIDIKTMAEGLASP